MAGGTKYIDLITLIQCVAPAVSPSAYATLFAARRTDNLEASINAGAYSIIGQEPAVPGLYGNGVDGDLNFNGSSTITLAGDASTIVPFANVYKLPRDIYPRSMIIANGVTVGVGAIAVGSFRIFCFGEANIIGILDANGGVGGDGGVNSIGSIGMAFGAGTIGAGSNGGQGNVLSAGGAGTNITYACGQIGGAGGAGSSYAGGAAGTLNAGPIPTAAEGSANVIRSVLAAMGGFAGVSPVNLIRGGSGGGGGGGDTANGGGGGGAGGNVIFLCAKAIIGAGTIRANGGAAGNAYQTSGNAGGGGGGGGGVVFTVSDTTPVPTIQANGGALGLGRGTGTNGNAGTTGVIVSLVRS